MAEQKKWLIIFLIYADFREDGFRMDEKTKRELDSLFGDLINCRLSEENKIIVAINRIKYSRPDQQRRVKVLNQTYLHHIVSNGDKNKVPLLVPVLNTEFNPLQKTDALANIFKEIEKNFIGERTFLITWDHGSAFGINRAPIETQSGGIISIPPVTEDLQHFQNIREFVSELPPDPFGELESDPVFFSNGTYFSVPGANNHEFSNHLNLVLKENLFNNKFFLDRDNGSNRLVFEKEPVEKNIRSKFTDDQVAFLKSRFDLVDNNFISTQIFPEIKFEILTNEELAEAISKGFQKNNIDVLLMMNCFMINLHSMFALKNNVDFLVGPQNGIDEPAYNYRGILNTLAQNNFNVEEGALELAKFCIKASDAIHRPEHKDAINQWALFAIHLKAKTPTGILALDSVCAGINQFAGEQLQEMRRKQDIRFLFRYTVRHCYRFDERLNYHMTDLLQWSRDAARVSNRNSAFLSATLPSFVAFLKRHQILIVKESLNTDKQTIYTIDNAIITHYRPSSLSIYFPSYPFIDEEAYEVFIKNNEDKPQSFVSNCKNWFTLLAEIVKD